MSLPPKAARIYDWQLEPGTEEAKLRCSRASINLTWVLGKEFFSKAEDETLY